MANNKINVKFTQTINQLQGKNVVTSGAVKLVPKGSGNSAITASKQDAVIEFFEVSDLKTTIMTISGSVVLDGGGPKFDLSSATRSSSVGNTDFVLPLDFDSATFDGSQYANQFSLKLPWKIIKHNNVATFKIAAQMKINGTIEGPASSADVLDLPLLHENVVDDIDTNVKDTCLGVGNVYPTNSLFATQTIPQTAGVQIYLQDGVRARYGVLAGSGTPPDPTKYIADDPARFIATIQTNVATILGGGGLRNITVTEKTSAQLGADWKLNSTDSYYYSTKVADPNHPQQGEGNLMDFFQFYFFASSGLSSTGGDALGIAEELNELQGGAPGISVANKTKLVLRAGRLLMAGLKSPMQTALQTAATESDKMNLMSNLIAHEVGHALGLRHCFSVDSKGYNAVPPTIGLMGSENIVNSAVQLAALGPVHAQQLKAWYP